MAENSDGQSVDENGRPNGIVDVICPAGHPGGHIASGLLGTQTCGYVLKSHQEDTPEETIDGDVVKAGKQTVADETCQEILVDPNAAVPAADAKPTETLLSDTNPDDA